MMMEELLDLFRRLPAQSVSSNLSTVLECLDPETRDELLSSVDQPLLLKRDSSGKEFLACDFNRDSDADADEGSGDAYRSPWNNEYHPSLPDGTKPSSRLRVLEQQANEAFSIYREMYYEGTGISSVYLWDLEEGNTNSKSFAGVVLLKKSTEDGSWDSIHVFETSERSRTGTYKLTSTIMLHMKKSGSSSTIGSLELGGSMTRQLESSLPLDPLPSSSTSSSSSSNSSSSHPINPSHISNIGRMIEDQEIKMRNLLQEVYFAKTRDVVNDLRSLRGSGEESKRKGLQGELVGLLRSRA